MTALGKFVLTLSILGLVGFGAYKWWDRLAPAGLASTPATVSATARLKHRVRHRPGRHA